MNSLSKLLYPHVLNIWVSFSDKKIMRKSRLTPKNQSMAKLVHVRFWYLCRNSNFSIMNQHQKKYLSIFNNANSLKTGGLCCERSLPIVCFHICLPCDFIETLITQNRLQTTRHFWHALIWCLHYQKKNDQRADSTPAASNTILPSFHILLIHPHPILVDSWLKQTKNRNGMDYYSID